MISYPCNTTNGKITFPEKCEGAKTNWENITHAFILCCKKVQRGFIMQRKYKE